ncbi:hypothetical protein MRS44_003783 [Fusarium solani]|uniref:uncharacterized protein n=1 Tax=Fusarium solani TaxID=169388 RepID=UPI0032C3E027|nr:hypothetical protein MRS44_003783 [Fusarium solani]
MKRLELNFSMEQERNKREWKLCEHTHYCINISGSLALFLRDTVFIEILDPDNIANINFSLPTQSLDHAAELCRGSPMQEKDCPKTEGQKSEYQELIRVDIDVTTSTEIIVKQGRPKLQDKTARSNSPFWSFHATVRGLELALIPKRDVKNCKDVLEMYEKTLSVLEEQNKKRLQ